VVATVLYLKVFRSELAGRSADRLNRRAESLVGHTFALAQALPVGESRLQIGDTFWRVRAPSALSAGTRVKVVAASDMALTLAAD
jgi:membrane protein implicated in regulation of membrane protease activity